MLTITKFDPTVLQTLIDHSSNKTHHSSLKNFREGRIPGESIEQRKLMQKMEQFRVDLEIERLEEDCSKQQEILDEAERKIDEIIGTYAWWSRRTPVIQGAMDTNDKARGGKIKQNMENETNFLRKSSEKLGEYGTTIRRRKQTTARGIQQSQWNETRDAYYRGMNTNNYRREITENFLQR